MTAAQYRAQLQALLPQGAAWPRGGDAQLTALLDAMAAEMARLDARGDALVDEADPRTTYELLPDWERVAGLPSACTAGVAQTVAERRDALVGRLTERGGQSIAYFVALAAKLGYTVTITAHRARRCGVAIGTAFGGTDWQFVWDVNSALNTVRKRACGSPCGEAFGVWQNTTLECVINDDKPAHTVVRFVYQ